MHERKRDALQRTRCVRMAYASENGRSDSFIYMGKGREAMHDRRRDKFAKDRIPELSGRWAHNPSGSARERSNPSGVASQACWNYIDYLARGGFSSPRRRYQYVLWNVR